MRPVSLECAFSDRKCDDCKLEGCNCKCHVIKAIRWREILNARARLEIVSKIGIENIDVTKSSSGPSN